jgi:hypothetical protein
LALKALQLSKSNTTSRLVFIPNISLYSFCVLGLNVKSSFNKEAKSGGKGDENCFSQKVVFDLDNWRAFSANLISKYNSPVYEEKNITT